MSIKKLTFGQHYYWLQGPALMSQVCGGGLTFTLTPDCFGFTRKEK